MGELKKWVNQNWVRIGTDGSIKGKCGTSKDKKTQTAAYQLQKLEASQKLKEHLQHERRREREQRARQWYLIQNKQKSQNLQMEAPLNGLSGVKKWLARLLLGDAAQS
tara:strand:+ start:15033 stop:15356 length:324 start_codon:yes stop_codon:yes gene_type:complete